MKYLPPPAWEFKHLSKFLTSFSAETSSQDAKFILEKANISHIPNVELPEMYSDSPQKSHKPEDYFNNVSKVTIERLHHAYRNDFRYFWATIYIKIC